MVSLETIEREINELETQYSTSYRLCERLAWLYICRDHLRQQVAPVPIDSGTQALEGSEFLELASGVSYTDLMRVLDEHMQALAAVQPRAYEATMDRIRSL